jgi:hypothetical protein
MLKTMWRVLVMSVLATGCTKRVNFCNTNSDCTNPAYPFCDVAGEFPESGGDPNTCTIIPADCPVERCGCMPGAAQCVGDQLSTCNTDGHSVATEPCALGCSTPDRRCFGFDPLNDLGPELIASEGQPDIVLPANSHIDTTSGSVTDSANLPITINSVVVTQGATTIRVFLAHSIVIHDVVVNGSSAFAVVAAGAIDVEGHLDASANTVNPGPGGQVGTPACTGHDGTTGGGGAGNATPGGAGDFSGDLPPVSAAGGATQSSFEPLIGGCKGGNGGGAGGGAVELVSRSAITFGNLGIVDIGGGGGPNLAGGGSGGLVILEAPSVHLGASSGVAANGGGGGACFTSGTDATPNPTPAPGAGPCGSGTPDLGGAGGTAKTAPAPGTGTPGTARGAGGGGAIGRLMVVTKGGVFDTNVGLLSVLVSTDALSPK